MDLLTSKSFPSGSRVVERGAGRDPDLLRVELLRDGRGRVGLVTAVAVTMWVAVCLDRVLLGRHYPTDVVAGSFLGIAVLLLGHRRLRPG